MYYDLSINNSKSVIEALFKRAEETLVEDYGFDFSNKEYFPNGFADFFGHTDAYADWLAEHKDMFDDVDYELLACLRFIIDTAEFLPRKVA